MGRVLDDAIANWPAPNATAGVANAQRLLDAAGPTDRPMPWASVTKLLTALAALIAVEEGVVDLDEPAGPPGSTVRHLLAHASGLPMDGPIEGDAPPALIAKPGTRRIYSNLGFETLTAHLATQAGMPFAEYLLEAVLVPLDLKQTSVEGSPASGATGPLTDLMALGRELLSPTLISAETLATATAVTFPNLAGVLPGFGRQDPNDWGLGFELRDHKAPHWTGTANSPQTFGHFGRSGSFLWVDPVAGLSCGSLSDRDFGPWAAEAWPALSDAMIANYA
jgi:CubicO group peptidase (beta-lactamase class C family)